MIRLILLSDFTESFSYNLLKGVLMYANSHEPWVVCRMPLSYKQTYGIKGVLKWAKTWHADAIIGRFDNDDNVEIFRENGLEVNFKAKPMIGLAGNGKHTHFGIGVVMKDGSYHNVFSPKDMQKDYMSAIGYGAIMGLLKNYEVINPFVSATNDSLNRLKTGFEAPVCIVTSL